MSMYIVAHKKFDPPIQSGYLPLQVGKGDPLFAGKFLRDCTGENIAEKNSTYCELTALYWIWKNCTDPIVGLCHYRRFFTQNALSRHPRHFLSLERAQEVLETYDLILPQKVHLKCTVRKQYFSTQAGFARDLDRLEQVIREHFPEYAAAYQKVMGQCAQHFWNMLVVPRPLLDAYCSWLFAVLDRMEEVTDLSGYDTRQRRIYGYLAERLMNVWVEKQQLRVFECPVVQTDRSRWAVVKTGLGIQGRRVRAALRGIRS